MRAQGKADGSIFVWNVVTSKLHSVLEGPLEKVVDITWHPHFNVLASVAAGKVAHTIPSTPCALHTDHGAF